MKRELKHIQKQVGMRILAEVAARYGVAVKDVASESRAFKFSRPRSEFYRLAHAAGVGPTMICKILDRDMSTAFYHVNTEYRKRKNAKRCVSAKTRNRRKCTTSRNDESASPV